MWKDDATISGFEVIFEYPNTSNWEPVSLIFGTKALITAYEEATIDFEVTGLEFRFSTGGRDGSLAAIKFKGVDSNNDIEICAEYVGYANIGTYELGARLVGFEVEEGMSRDGSVYNIRAIRPLQDSTSCQTAEHLRSDLYDGYAMISLIIDPIDEVQTTLDLSDMSN